MGKARYFQILCGQGSCVILWMMSACAPGRNDQTTAKVNLVLQERGLQSQSLGDYISDEYCYAIHVTTPNDPASMVMFNRLEPSNPEKPTANCPYRPIGPGMLSQTFAAPGEELTMELPIGSDRRFDLIAVPKSQLGNTCKHSLGFGLNSEEADKADVLVDGKVFNNEFDQENQQSFRILAYSPLTTIVGGENVVTLSNVVASSSAGLPYVCDDSSNEPFRLMMPFGDQNGNVRTGMVEPFLRVQCSSKINKVQLTISDVDRVLNRQGSPVAMSGGKYSVQCATDPDFKGLRLATFSLIKHSAGTFQSTVDKKFQLQGYWDGSAIGNVKSFNFVYSPNYKNLMNDKYPQPGPSPTPLLFTLNTGTPKFVASFKKTSAAGFYQKLAIDVMSTSGGVISMRDVDLAVPGSYPHYGQSSVINQTSLTNTVRHENLLLRTKELSFSQELQTSSFLSNWSTWTSVSGSTITNTMNKIVSDGTTSIQISTDATTYCQFIGMRNAGTVFHSTQYSNCPGGPPDFQVVIPETDDVFSLVASRLNAGAAELMFYKYNGSGWITPDIKTLQSSQSSIPTVTRLRNGINQLVALWKSGTSNELFVRAALTSSDGTIQVDRFSSKFFPAWGPGATVNFVKALNLEDLAGYSVETDLVNQLSDFSNREVLAGGSIEENGNHFAVLYKSVNGGKSWHQVYKSTVSGTATIDAVPVIQESKVNNKTYRRVGFAVLEENGSEYGILVQNAQGF